MKKIALLLIILLNTFTVFAQGASPAMDDTFRSSGKIYVVVAIIAVIFVGLAIYLFSMDRRIKKIEKGN